MRFIDGEPLSSIISLTRRRSEAAEQTASLSAVVTLPRPEDVEEVFGDDGP